MNRLRSTLCAFLLPAAALGSEAAARFDPCALLKKSEIEAVQGDRVVATKASEPERDRFAVSQCFYTLATFSKSVSLEVTRRRPGEEAEGPRRHWEQMFSRALRKEDKEAEEERPGEKGEREERGGARPHAVEGVGDQAYWDGSTIGGGLYVLQGDAYMRLSVGGRDSQAVKTEKLKKLARKALPRLREKKTAR